MEKIAVSIRTKEEYQELMDIYEKKGWKWYDGDLTKSKNYGRYRIGLVNICIGYYNNFELSQYEDYFKKGYKIINLEELKKIEQENKQHNMLVIGNQNGMVINDLVYRPNIQKELPLPRLVYVSDTSIEDAFKRKDKRLLVAVLPSHITYKYIVVDKGDEDNFLNDRIFKITTWKYIVEIHKNSEEKIIKIKTEDGKTINIDVEKGKELGFIIKR